MIDDSRISVEQPVDNNNDSPKSRRQTFKDFVLKRNRKGICVYFLPEGPKVAFSATEGAIIRVLTYRRYANITAWCFFVFSHVPRRYAELLLSAYLFFAGST
jgi:hypothetical protein